MKHLEATLENASKYQKIFNKATVLQKDFDDIFSYNFELNSVNP